MSVSISYLQALLGTKKTVKGLTGSLDLDIPPGLSSGEEIRFRNQGLPGLKDPVRGDLICEIQVKLPKKLKKREEELLREIADLKKESVLNKKTKVILKGRPTDLGNKSVLNKKSCFKRLTAFYSFF